MNRIPSIELYDIENRIFLNKKDFFIWGRDLYLFRGHNHTSKEDGLLYKKINKTINHYLCKIENKNKSHFIGTYPFQDRIFDNRYVLLDNKIKWTDLNKLFFKSLDN